MPTSQRRERTALLYDEDYDERSRIAERLFFAPMRAKLAVAAGPIRGRVVDLAVSTGKGLGLYRAQDCQVVGVDLSSRALGRAVERAKDLRVSFEPIVADVMRLPIADESVDCVVCQLGFCTFEDPLAVLREVRRVCRRDARVMLVEHVLPERRLPRTLAALAADRAQREFGCNTMRDTLGMFAAEGFVTEFDASAAGGFMHSTILRPPPRDHSRASRSNRANTSGSAP